MPGFSGRPGHRSAQGLEELAAGGQGADADGQGAGTRGFTIAIRRRNAPSEVAVNSQAADAEKHRYCCSGSCRRSGYGNATRVVLIPGDLLRRPPAIVVAATGRSE